MAEPTPINPEPPTDAPQPEALPVACVNGMKPDTLVKVPAESQFGRENYLKDPELDKIVAGLIRKSALGLGDLLEQEVEIATRWRKKGSRSRGEPVLSSIRKAGGILGFEMQKQYVIEIAADHVRAFGLTHFQLEARLYHELLHIRVDVDTDNNVNLGMRAHTVEAFGDELKHYGAWMVTLGEFREVIKQAPLFGHAVSTFDRQRAALNPEKKTEPGNGSQTRSARRRAE